jgi:hypothetical protein
MHAAVQDCSCKQAAQCVLEEAQPITCAAQAESQPAPSHHQLQHARGCSGPAASTPNKWNALKHDSDVVTALGWS